MSSRAILNQIIDYDFERSQTVSSEEYENLRDSESSDIVSLFPVFLDGRDPSKSSGVRGIFRTLQLNGTPITEGQYQVLMKMLSYYKNGNPVFYRLTNLASEMEKEKGYKKKKGYLRHDYGTSCSSIKRYVKSLDEAGLIVRKKDSSNKNPYYYPTLKLFCFTMAVLQGVFAKKSWPVNFLLEILRHFDFTEGLSQERVLRKQLHDSLREGNSLEDLSTLVSLFATQHKLDLFYASTVQSPTTHGSRFNPSSSSDGTDNTKTNPVCSMSDYQSSPLKKTSPPKTDRQLPNHVATEQLTPIFTPSPMQQEKLAQAFPKCYQALLNLAQHHCRQHRVDGKTFLSKALVVAEYIQLSASSINNPIGYLQHFLTDESAFENIKRQVSEQQDISAISITPEVLKSVQRATGLKAAEIKQLRHGVREMDEQTFNRRLLTIGDYIERSQTSSSITTVRSPFHYIQKMIKDEQFIANLNSSCSVPDVQATEAYLTERRRDCQQAEKASVKQVHSCVQKVKMFYRKNFEQSAHRLPQHSTGNMDTPTNFRSRMQQIKNAQIPPEIEETIQQFAETHRIGFHFKVFKQTMHNLFNSEGGAFFNQFIDRIQGYSEVPFELIDQTKQELKRGC